MSDTPNTQAAAVPPQAPAVVPPPQSVLNPPAPAKAAPAAELEPTTVIQFTDAQGNEQALTLAEMAKRATDQRLSLAEDDLKRYELFKKATTQNDSDAARALVEAYLPAKQQTAELTPAEKKMAEMEAELKAVRERLDQASKVTGQIDYLTQKANMEAVIEKAATEVPWLAAVPDRAERVMTKLQQAQALAKQAGIDLATHPRRRDVMVRCIQEANAELETTAKLFGGQAPAAKAAANGKPQPPGVVDDQRKGSGSTRTTPARYQVINGQIVDTLQNGAAQAQLGSGAMATIPTGLIQPPTAAGGTMTPNAGPMTTAGLANMIKARMQSMNQVQE